MSSSTYSNLVRDTFQMRRKFITQEANSSKEILNVCTYLGKPSHVQSELSRIIGAENVSGAEDRLKEALKVLHGGENLTNVEVVKAMKMIQERTKRKNNNQDVFKFQDPMTPPDKLFRDNRIEFFLVCVGSIDNIEQVFLC